MRGPSAGFEPATALQDAGLRLRPVEELDFRYSDEIAMVAQAAFAEHAAQITERLPYVEVRHVGGTSVYGLLTAGDVDLQVRVARGKSQHARTVLQEMYAPLYPDAWQETAYFYAPAAEPRVEIALTVMGNVDDLLLIESWDRIAAEPALADAYNALKRAHEGKPPEAYQAAKRDFFYNTFQLQGTSPSTS